LTLQVLKIFLGQRTASSHDTSIFLNTLANLTLIILFSKMLKFSKIISSKLKKIVKENSEYLGIFHLLK